LLLPLWLHWQFSHKVEWSQCKLPWFSQSHSRSQQIGQFFTPVLFVHCLESYQMIM
jgi:hypothetical protein